MTKPIRLYPVPGVSLYPWPAVEFDATPADADLLLGYHPPPFATTRPPGTDPETPPQDPPDGGSSDSTED